MPAAPRLGSIVIVIAVAAVGLDGGGEGRADAEALECVRVGMTGEDVRSAPGQPFSINENANLCKVGIDGCGESRFYVRKRLFGRRTGDSLVDHSGRAGIVGRVAIEPS